MVAEMRAEVRAEMLPPAVKTRGQKCRLMETYLRGALESMLTYLKGLDAPDAGDRDELAELLTQGQEACPQCRAP